MNDQRCPCCGNVIQDDVLSRLAYRRGQMLANGFPWQRKDIALLKDACDEIVRLRHPKSPEDAA